MRSELRHLLMRHRAFEKRKRRDEVHIVGLRNEVRGAFGADPIDPYSASSKKEQSTGKDEAARHAMLRQMDISEEEEMTAGELQNLTN